MNSPTTVQDRLLSASRSLSAPRLLIAVLGASLLMAVAYLLGVPDPSGKPGALKILVAWTPAILLGFGMNLWISAVSIVVATILGLLVGIGRVSPRKAVRALAWSFTNFFRNAPWLVILFYCMLLMPFRGQGGGMVIPDWAKASLGIAIPAAANMAEIVRGAIQSIPTGQWEAARSLAFSRTQIIWMVILPQCVRRMLPSWTNLYALVVISTPLCAIVGVQEGMAAVIEMLAAYERPDLLLPAYAFLLLIFFAFCWPIARLTRTLELRLRSGD